MAPRAWKGSGRRCGCVRGMGGGRAGPGGVIEQALAVVDDEDSERSGARVRRESLQETPAQERGRGERADDERLEVVCDGQHGLHGRVGDGGAAGCEVYVPPERGLAEEGVEQPRDSAEDEALPRGQHGHHAQNEVAGQVLQRRLVRVLSNLHRGNCRRRL